MVTQRGLLFGVLLIPSLLNTKACRNVDDIIENDQSVDSEIERDTASDLDTDTSPFHIVSALRQPDVPNCVASRNDSAVSNGLLDLALGYSHRQFFLLKNALNSEGESLEVSPNGIFIDETEVLLISGNGGVFQTVNNPAELYISPETTLPFSVKLIHESQGEALAEQYNCLPVSNDNYGVETVATSDGNPAEGELTTILARVTVSGRHVFSQVSMETPAFNFDIRLCCGCLVKWEGCTTPCDAYCTEPDDSSVTCLDGVGNDDTPLVDCRHFYSNPTATWDGLGACVDPDGSTRLCECRDCDI